MTPPQARALRVILDRFQMGDTSVDDESDAAVVTLEDYLARRAALIDVERERFSQAAVFEAEGGRLGLVTCLGCGAALLLDPRDEFDPMALHLDVCEVGA